MTMTQLDRLTLVAGVDEAGRGPLAGPVVAAAVIVGERVPDGVGDSKQLSAARRDILFNLIVDTALAVAYCAVSPRKIDETNVLQATFNAMRGAVNGLAFTPSVVHVDGHRTIPGVELPQRAFVAGDRNCIAIGAASIVAKVVRDRMMTMWDRVYPNYKFAAHKGYGTGSHTEALTRYGPCAIHRYSFSPVRERSLFPALSS